MSGGDRSVPALASLLRDRSGASSVEFALVVPVLLLMVFGAIGGGILANATVSLQRATEVAARCVTLQGTLKCADAASITTAGTSAYKGPTLTGLTFVANPSASCPNRVTGSGTYKAIAGIGFASATLTANACYPGR